MRNICQPRDTCSSLAIPVEHRVDSLLQLSAARLIYTARIYPGPLEALPPRCLAEGVYFLPSVFVRVELLLRILQRQLFIAPRVRENDLSRSILVECSQLERVDVEQSHCGSTSGHLSVNSVTPDSCNGMESTVSRHFRRRSSSTAWSRSIL